MKLISENPQPATYKVEIPAEVMYQIWYLSSRYEGGEAFPLGSRGGRLFQLVQQATGHRFPGDASLGGLPTPRAVLEQGAREMGV